MQALAPIFAYFLIGVLLRVFNIASREQSLFIFRLIFYVTLPALVFTTISGITPTIGSLVLPTIGFLVNLTCAAIAIAYAKVLKLDRLLSGAVILGASITNMVFMFPFISAVLGEAALADAVLYDVGNSVFVATVAYAVTSRYGDSSTASVWLSVLKMLRSPLFLALLAAVAAAYWRIETPALIRATLAPLGAATIPLILIALGASSSIAKLRDSIVYSTVMIRMAGGLIVGGIFVTLFELQGATAATVICAAAAPIGFNSVTLVSIGKLDIDHATASLSAAVAIGLLTAPALVLIASYWLAATV